MARQRKSLWGDPIVGREGIIRAMCSVSDLTKEQAHYAHNLMMAVIWVQLEYGNSVKLDGVGILKVEQLPERPGMVPDPEGLRSRPGNWGNRYTYDWMPGMLPPKWKLRFEAQKRVKDAMKTGPQRKIEREEKKRIKQLIKQYC